MNIIDWILFTLLALCVGYLLLYAIASKFYRAPRFPDARTFRRFVVLFPAYKEDRVIASSVRSFLQQDYPQELFDIIVISDQMQDATNEDLRSLPIHLLIADYRDSSKAKALTMAVESVSGEHYDIVAIMDADNLTSPDFLAEINRAFDNGARSVQAHRTGKNMNTDISVLDGISEEINNGIFRSGHNALGLSAALSGSGMAFEAEWFRKNVRLLETAGEDKELEVLLLQQRIHTTYLPQIPAYDEKILQWMLPPRLIQLAGVFGLTFIFTVIGVWQAVQGTGQEWTAAIKWWILSAAQIMAMLLPIPGRLLDKRLGKAILRIPLLALTTLGNLFKLKGAYKKFIHTEHYENSH